MTIDIDIFGSVVCRDIIRHDDKKRYAVKRCLNGIPLTTLYEATVELPKEKIAATSLSKYDQRMLEIQASRDAVDLLKASDGKILLMDLADELLHRFFIEEEGWEKYLALDKKHIKDVEKMFLNGTKNKDVINQQSPFLMDLAIVNDVYKRFAREIVQSNDNPNGYKEKNIVVIEAYYAEKIIDKKSGKVKNQPREYEVKRSNELLQNLYQILYRHIPGCVVIKMPEFTHTSENHLRGPSPLSFTEETYEYFLKVLDVLSGYNKVNAVANIYDEQNLSNKLYTRLLNASSIYSIDAMMKDIQALKKENERQRTINKKLKEDITAQKLENEKLRDEKDKLEEDVATLLREENHRLKVELSKLRKGS